MNKGSTSLCYDRCRSYLYSVKRLAFRALQGNVLRGRGKEVLELWAEWDALAGSMKVLGEKIQALEEVNRKLRKGS